MKPCKYQKKTTIESFALYDEAREQGHNPKHFGFLEILGICRVLGTSASVSFGILVIYKILVSLYKHLWDLPKKPIWWKIVELGGAEVSRCYF